MKIKSFFFVLTVQGTKHEWLSDPQAARIPRGGGLLWYGVSLHLPWMYHRFGLPCAQILSQGEKIKPRHAWMPEAQKLLVDLLLLLLLLLCSITIFDVEKDVYVTASCHSSLFALFSCFLSGLLSYSFKFMRDGASTRTLSISWIFPPLWCLPSPCRTGIGYLLTPV